MYATDDSMSLALCMLCLPKHTPTPSRARAHRNVLYLLRMVARTRLSVTLIRTLPVLLVVTSSYCVLVF
jgi:hypothetical protein